MSSIEQELIRQIKYQFGRNANERVGAYTFVLADNAKKVLDDVITYLQKAAGEIDCPECKGAKRFGFSIPFTGTVQLVACNTCKGAGVVKEGTEANPLSQQTYSSLAQAKYDNS